MGQSDGRRDGGKWIDYNCILGVDLIGFVNGMDVDNQGDGGKNYFWVVVCVFEWIVRYL